METGLPCVHCGLCLDTCPTYRVLGSEADSPRGRIHIMEAVDRGELRLDREAAAHLDGCLGCLACETACPSGVSFGSRIERFRERVREEVPAGPWRRLVQRVVQRPGLISLAKRSAVALDALGLGRLRRKLPGIGLMPSRRRALRGGLEPLAPAGDAPRVAVLAGCVADDLMPSIHAAAVETLRHNGVEVVELRGQCCGALALHAGRTDEAAALARRTVAAIEALGVDRVVTTAAGCGAAMREYGHRPPAAGDGEEAGSAAARVAGKTMDVSELLVELGPREPARRLDERIVAYHDACHLLHASGVAAAPRAVVRAATGRTPSDLGDNHICCGSAGSYNLEHPPMAIELGNRKAALAAGGDADTIAVANVGCIMQIERALAMTGQDLRVRHPVELLAEAYRREAEG